MRRAITPGTAITLTHDPEDYQHAQLVLLRRIVRVLNRGVFHYVETP